MLKLSSAVAGMTVQKMYIMTQVFEFTYYYNMEPEINLWEENIRGTIETNPSGYSNFNNCNHKEAYGTIYLPSKTKDNKWITYGPHVKWPWDTGNISAEFLRYSKDLGIDYGTPFQQTGGYIVRSTPCDLATYMSAVVFFDDYGYYKNVGLDGSQWDSGIKLLSDPGDYSTWTRIPKGRTYDIVKTNSKNKCAEEIKQLIDSASADQEAVISLHREKGFADVMDTMQDVPTTSIALQVGVDGLICQAVSSIMSAALNGFTKAGARNKLVNLAKIDLATKYGVLAPFKDYIDLFNTIKRYETDGSGLVPFFKGSKSARQTVTGGGWEHQLVFGICWDYLHASTWDDFFGILYQAGLLGISPSQAWDLVPFSFAIDWFFNLTSLMEGLDAQLNAIRYPIRYTWQTAKSTTKLTWMDQTFEVVIYTRTASGTLPAHVSYWEVGDLKGTLSTSNAAEAVSLVVSMFL